MAVVKVYTKEHLEETIAQRRALREATNRVKTDFHTVAPSASRSRGSGKSKSANE